MQLEWKKLAIKVIRPEYSQRRLFMSAFERELTTVFSSNIVRVYEQVIEGTCALVMEFMDSPDLAQFLTFKPQGCIPWEDEQNPTLVGCNTKKIAEQVLSALHYAHTREHPIFHLDIKPANIKLDSQNNRIKILDFGIAAIKDSDDLIKASAGTIEYIPPEQWRRPIVISVWMQEQIGMPLAHCTNCLRETSLGKGEFVHTGKENTQDFPSPRKQSGCSRTCFQCDHDGVATRSQRPTKRCDGLFATATEQCRFKLYRSRKYTRESSKPKKRR